MRDVFDSISREFEYNFFNLRYYEDYPYLQPASLSSIIDEADVILDYHFSKPIPSYFHKRGGLVFKRSSRAKV